MKDTVILALLWEKHTPLLLHYLSGVTPRHLVFLNHIGADTLARMHTLGHKTTVLKGNIVPRHEQQRIHNSCINMRTQLRAAFASPVWRTFCDTQGIPSDSTSATITQTLITDRLSIAASIIQAFEAINRRHFIELMVLSEDVTYAARCSIVWGRKNQIPSLHIQHGYTVGLASVHRNIFADYMTVFGIQGVNNFSHVDPARIYVVGHHDWEVYRQLCANQASIRAQILQKYALQPDIPVILFATTTAGKLSAFYAQNIHQQTLKAMFLAKQYLLAQNIPIQLVIKERFSNIVHEQEAHICAQVAHTCGFSALDYTYTTTDVEALIVSADVLVSSDSSVNVEAMHAGTPAINLITHFSFQRYALLHVEDGVMDICDNDAQALAQQIQAVLTNQDYRSRIVAKMRAHVTRYNLTAHSGHATDNVARVITSLCR